MNISNNLKQLKFMKVAAEKKEKKEKETLGACILKEMRTRSGTRGRGSSPESLFPGMGEDGHNI